MKIVDTQNFFMSNLGFVLFVFVFAGCLPNTKVTNAPHKSKASSQSGLTEVAQHANHKKDSAKDEEVIFPLCLTKAGKQSPHCAKLVTPVFDQNGKLLVIWSSGKRIYVSVSQGNGKAFGEPIELTEKEHEISSNPENRPLMVSAPNGDLYAIFTVRGKTKRSGIVYFSRSVDGGKSFSKPHLVSDEESITSQAFAGLNVDATGTITVTWLDSRDRTKAKATGVRYNGSAIYYMQSHDGGKTFTPNKKIADSACQCCRIGVQTVNDRAVLLWRHIFGDNIRDHALVNIDNKGQSGAVRRLSEDKWHLKGCPHHGPAIDIDRDGRYHVVWFTGGETRKGLFYSASSDQGQTFSTPIGFGDQYQSSHPYVLTADKRVFVTWKEFNGTATEIKYKYSPDNGNNWSSPTSIVSSSSESGHPLLLHDDKWVYLSWRTSTEGYRLFKIAGHEGKGI